MGLLHPEKLVKNTISLDDAAIELMQMESSQAPT